MVIIKIFITFIKQLKKLIMIIKKYFATMKQAEQFLNRLYNKYDSVTCLICPPLESGVYVFKCN